MLDDLLRRRDVPDSERALAAVANGGGKDGFALNREFNRLERLVGVGKEGDRQRRLHDDLLGISLEQEQGTEHVLVRLQH